MATRSVLVFEVKTGQHKGRLCRCVGFDRAKVSQRVTFLDGGDVCLIPTGWLRIVAQV